MRKERKDFFGLEEKLGIMKKVQKQEKQIQKILSEISQIQTKNTDDEVERSLNEIREELQYI